MTGTETTAAAVEPKPEHGIQIRLGVLLADRGMTSAELAERIGIHQNNVSRIKNGHIEGFKLATLAAICEALDCEPGDLLVRERVTG